MKKAVFGIIGTSDQAATLVTELGRAGFAMKDISVVLPSKEGTLDFAYQHQTKAPEGAMTGGIAGGTLGGTLGLLIGVGALAIPGLGALIAAGPIMAALSGAAVGAAVGGLAGGLVGLGIPEVTAKAYESRVKAGNVLIAVHTDSTESVKRVKDVFVRNGADDVFMTGESGGPIKESRPLNHPL